MSTEGTNTTEPTINFEKLIKSLPRLAQALSSDSVLYFADEEEATKLSRKELIVTNTKLLRERLGTIEKVIDLESTAQEKSA